MLEFQPDLQTAALAQAAYYLLSGLWPVVSLRSFMAVTGPKIDTWLVRTFGLFVAAVGLAFLVAGLQHSFGPEVVTLGLGCAAALCVADVVYVLSGRIAPTYLVDAVAEGGLIALWVLALQP